MKAITLTQPWATLVAIEAKRIETRSWYTNYRGPLAIHAAKGFPRTCMDLCGQAPFSLVLSPHYNGDCEHIIRVLPRGAVVATCRLAHVCRTPPKELTKQERSFGDYTQGRFAWILEDVEMLATPIPATGMLGLWDWKR